MSRAGKTYYEILGVPHDAGELEIKAAYHRLARKYHPDKSVEGTDQGSLEAEFALISSAYNVLKDREKRSAYDQGLELKRQKESAAGFPSAPTTSAPDRDRTSGIRSGVAELEKSRISIARRAFLKGLQYQAGGDFQKAIEFFEVAIKNHDADPAYHSKLAQTLLRTQRSFSRATEAAQRAIELDPFNAEHRLVLAELYETAGSKSLAVKAYEDILRWDPQNDRARIALDHLVPSRKSIIARLFRKH